MIKTKSPIFYSGNKFKLLDKIAQYIPSNKEGTFYDVFGGSGTMTLNFADKYKKAIYNDFDVIVYKLFKWATTMSETGLNDLRNKMIALDNRYNFFIKDMNLTEIKAWITKNDITKRLEYEGWNNFLTYENVNKNSEADILWIATYCAFSHNLRFVKDGSFGKSYGAQVYRDPAQFGFLSASRFKNIEYTNKSFQEIDINKLTENDFIYLDPPYLITDNGSYDDKWTEELQKELYKFCEELDRRKIKWAMSGVFENKGIKNHSLKNWSTKNNYKVWSFNHTYSTNGTGGYAEEVLICNYEYARNGIQLSLDDFLV